MENRRLLRRLLQGHTANVMFEDMQQLLKAFGFQLQRTRGSHHIYTHPAVRELVNLQEVHGKAKSYQIKQALRLVERYALTLEEG